MSLPLGHVLFVDDPEFDAYGNKGDVTILERIWAIVREREKKLAQFWPALFRMKHFFKCLNVVLPEDLAKEIKRLE
ncbi:hypothetical protein QR680_009754 [Steinernema hermaphroditum]|uniref:Uncharacterized protein n=1 Tax=Steinernema hermaphroditum TaxID=289476 RepID=A0AA39MAJ5_9BILA|nr:hypothetical protein QR680_009754 [Steinernema hermaphroditum]